MEIYENLSLENLDDEIWKEIEEYGGDYQISNLGRVKSFKRYKEGKILEPVDVNGYSCVNLCKNGKKGKPIYIHILMVENHIGKIPEGCEVHHKDFTKNDFLDNFRVMNKGEHRRIHNSGEKHPNYGKHPSEETKKKQSETMKEKFKNGELNMKGENHPNYGKHRSEETKRKQSEKMSGENHPNYGKDFSGENGPNHTLTEEKIIKIRIDLDEGILTQAEIAEKFGISQSTISLIKNKKRWNIHD